MKFVDSICKTTAKPNKDMEREITRRSSVVLKGLEIPELASLASNVFAFGSGHDSAQPSPDKAGGSGGAPAEASHRRVYDASRWKLFVRHID